MLLYLIFVKTFEIILYNTTDVCIYINSKDDRLPNLDATRQSANAENTKQDVEPTRVRRHFPSNINKIGYIFFSVSCIYLCMSTLSICMHI